MERSCSIPISWWPFENPGPKFVWCCFEKSRLHLHEGISMDYRLHQISMPPNATDHAAFQAFRQQYYSFIGIWRRYLSLKVLTCIYFVELRVHENDRVEIPESQKTKPLRELLDSLHKHRSGLYHYSDNLDTIPFTSKELRRRFHSREGQGGHYIAKVPGRIPEVTFHDSGIAEYGLHFVHGLRFAGVLLIVLIWVFLSLGLGVAVDMRTDTGIGAGVGGGILAALAVFLSFLQILLAKK
ncbi:Protein of unknown function [Pyronema omphalodes CBS 100304]|uniref:Uncharacterized protein n=1 Tax=Pyronema omphalodes (strain CBS 100304) TaxID=1076935 RepID=U4L1Y7_PYROM|nr:Protein of unknown function [Pyronema omphalodes CBS 100304]